MQITVNEADAYLLMSVADALHPADLVKGGSGGRKGNHGTAGAGGPGGAGGKSHSWTTTGRNNRTVHHSKPGGSRGPSGPRGSVPTSTLRNGSNGADGCFIINIRNERGEEKRYSRRFHLTVHSFIIAEQAAEPDGIFEFGERCFVDQIRVQNTGGMPTVPLQREMVCLDERNEWVKPAPSEAVFTKFNASLPPGEMLNVEGTLRYAIAAAPDISVETDFDPIVKHEDVQVTTWQLGMETETENGVNTIYRMPFTGKHFKANMRVQYPVRNTNGLVGLTSIAPGESSVIKFSVENISKLPMGFDYQGTQHRNVGVLLFMSLNSVINPKTVKATFLRYDDQAGGPAYSPAAGMELKNELCMGINPSPTRSIGDMQPTDFYHGDFLPFPSIPPNGGVGTIHCKLSMGKQVAAYSYGELHAHLFLENLYCKQWKCVQKRCMEIRCEPAFNPTEKTQAILITSTATTQAAYNSWMKVLTHDFNLDTVPYAVSRYGQFNPLAIIPGSLDSSAPMLGNVLHETLIVVLDDEFEVKDTSGGQKELVRRIAPSDLVISNWLARNYIGAARKVMMPNTSSNGDQPPSSSSSMLRHQEGPSFLVVSSQPGQAFDGRAKLAAVRNAIPDIPSITHAQRTRVYTSLAQYKKYSPNFAGFRRGSYVFVRDPNNPTVLKTGVIQRFLREIDPQAQSQQQRHSDAPLDALYEVALLHERLSAADSSQSSASPQIISVSSADLSEALKPVMSEVQSIGCGWVDTSLDPMLEYEVIPVKTSVWSISSSVPSSTHCAKVVRECAEELEQYMKSTRGELDYCIVMVDAQRGASSHAPVLRKLDGEASCCVCFRSIWLIGELRIFTCKKQSKITRTRIFHMRPDSAHAEFTRDNVITARSAVTNNNARDHSRAAVSGHNGYDTNSMFYCVARALGSRTVYYHLSTELAKLTLTSHPQNSQAPLPPLVVAITEAILANFTQEIFQAVDFHSDMHSSGGDVSGGEALNMLSFIPTLSALVQILSTTVEPVQSSGHKACDGECKQRLLGTEEARDVMSQMMSRMYAITKGPGAYRWYQCCGAFRCGARQLRSLLEGTINDVGKMLNNKNALRIDQAIVEQTHTEIQIFTSLTGKKTTRHGLLARFGTAGWLRFVLPQQLGLRPDEDVHQIKGKANCHVMAELEDCVSSIGLVGRAAKSDDDTKSYILSETEYENLCLSSWSTSNVSKVTAAKVENQRRGLTMESTVERFDVEDEKSTVCGGFHI